MSSIRKNYLYNASYQVLTILIPLITTPYISRVLGAEGVGVYSYAYSVAQYFTLFIMLGLNNYGNRSIASVKDDSKELSKTFWNIYAMQFVLGILVTISYFMYSYFIAYNKSAALIMGIFVVSACFDINWFFFGMEKFRLTVLRNTIIKISTTLSIFIFVKDKEDVYIYCLILVLGILISQLVLWVYIKQFVDFTLPRWENIRQHIKPNLLLFLTVIAVSLYKIMDKIMLGIMTDTREVGLFESSERIISIPISFITSLGTVMLPRMTNMIANKNKGLYSLLYKSVILAVFLSSSMGFGIMGVSKVFVPLFYGEGYDRCVQLFLVLLPSCLFLAFGNVIRTQYLLPNKMDKIYIISAFLGAIVNIIMNIILIPEYGALGAGIGTLFAEAMVCIYQAHSVKKKIPVLQYCISSLPLLISGIIMFLILFNTELALANPIIELFLLIVLGILIYFLVLFILFLIQINVIKLYKKRKCRK